MLIHGSAWGGGSRRHCWTPGYWSRLILVILVLIGIENRRWFFFLPMDNRHGCRGTTLGCVKLACFLIASVSRVSRFRPPDQHGLGQKGKQGAVARLEISVERGDDFLGPDHWAKDSFVDGRQAMGVLQDK